MRSIRLRVTLCALGVLCLAGLVSALQGPVALRLKFAPNETARYRFYAEITGTAVNQAGPGQPMTVPIEAVLTVEATAKVLGLDPAGIARLALKLEKGTLLMSVLGQPVKITLANGQLKVSGGTAQDQVAQMLEGQAEALSQPIVIRIDPRGKILEVQLPSSGGLLNSVMGGMDPNTLLQQGQSQLPEHPVAVGETWKEHQAVPLGGSEAVSDGSYTLAGLETRNGKTLARITFSATTALDGANLSQMNPGQDQAVQGTMSMQTRMAGAMLFDVTAGRLARLDFSLTQGMTSNMTVAQPGQQPVTMTGNTTLTMKGALAAL